MIKVKFIKLACLPNLNARLIFKVFLILVLSVVFIIEQISAQDNKTCTTDLKGDMEFLIATSKLNLTDSLLNNVHKESPFEEDRIAKMKQRLRQNLEEFWGRDNVDENRYEQEVLFYVDKMDITEEKIRLEQHCKYFIEQLDNEVTSKGRQLNFITQEMGREINTLGAKAYHSEIQHLVVGMKDELEKIKEQIANVL